MPRSRNRRGWVRIVLFVLGLLFVLTPGTAGGGVNGDGAAFSVRAVELADNDGGRLFVDDDGGSIFGSDVVKLGTAGVRLGCNPPAIGRYCPDSVVARDQTATFRTGALGLTPMIPPQRFTYTVGMTADIITDNYWAFIGRDGTPFMSYVLGPTKPSLFRIAYPGVVVAPDVAVGLPAAAVQEGDVWTVTQPIRDDYTWSDGSALTAADVVFTFTTVRDAELGGGWISAYPYTEASSPRLLNVEALDDTTVRFTFDSKPGAAVWPHTVGVASIMPKAPWESVVAEALASADPAAVIYGASSLDAGDLSGGPVSYNGREAGAFIENVKNENYSNAGSTHTFWEDGSYALNGELLYGEGQGAVSVEYVEGPYLDRTLFLIYGDEAAAMLALTEGEIDFWINPGGVPPGLQQQGFAADNLDVTVNPTNGFRYLAFNLRKSPGKFLGFRQAMAYFDKENLADNILQGDVHPLYVLVPEGNQAWYDKARADAIAGKYVGLSMQQRLNKAYDALEADGFTWITPPERDAEGNIVTPAAGIIDPDGTLVPEVEILAPSATLDPLRHTASLRIEDWAENLGVNAKTVGTDFNTIVAQVWPGVGVTPDFDMYILGWSLGNPAWPRFHESFFHTRNWAETNDGNNSTGYSDPEFDALADAMFTETDQATAFDQIWQMEEKLATDLPYVVLFDTPITEFYNKDLNYPFTGTLSGIQNLNGMQGTVTHSACVALPPNGTDTVGLIDPAQGLWHLCNSVGVVTSFYYGNPSDIPFVGDWDCDGDDTPGLFRQSDAFAYLRNSNTHGIADIRFLFGNPNDIPLAGDFNGDGCDTVSLYRPSTQEFFIINELGENEGGLGAAEFSFLFGNPGDKPVVGDWDGDGVDEVGLHRDSTGLFYWRNTLTTGIADGTIIFGNPGDRFMAGDWGVVDGKDTPAVFRPSNTTMYFRHTLTTGNANSQFIFGQPPWLPVAGDFGLG